MLEHSLQSWKVGRLHFLLAEEEKKEHKEKHRKGIGSAVSVAMGVQKKKHKCHFLFMVDTT